MPKFQPAPEPELAPLTPNRQALADLNAARQQAAAEVETLRARMASLARLRNAVAPIEAELAALDASEAAALAEWSLTPDEPAPEPDVAARDDIVARLQAARQKVQGADAATISVEHVLASANTRAGDLERQVPVAVASVLIDEAYVLLPAITESTALLARTQVRYSALREFLLSRAEASRDVAMRSGFFQSLEALDIAARHAANNAPAPDFNSTAEWRELAASLGDTPARPTAVPIAAFPNMPVEDKWTNS
jgi:hypothetical protein